MCLSWLPGKQQVGPARDKARDTTLLMSSSEGTKKSVQLELKEKRQEAGNGTKTCLEGGMLGACSPVGCPTCSDFYVNGIETCSGVWNQVVTQSLRMQCITKRRSCKGWEG